MLIPAVILALMYGLLFGSFANAVAYRVPTGETLMTRSHCPNCNAKITAWQNVPILSWVFLRGKCANCRNPISIQYPAVELLTSLLFGAVTYRIFSDEVFGESWITVLVAVVLCYFVFIGVVLSIIDFKTMTLPRKLIYPTVIFSYVVLAGAALLFGDPSRILSMLIGGAGSFAVLFIIWWFFPKGMGYGDVRLMLLTGGILGWFSVGHSILGFMLPFVLAAIIFAPLLAFKVISRKSKIPLGPWIILGAILSVLFGDILINTYLSVGGFL